MTTRLPDIEEPIDTLDSILTDHRIAWLQMLNELNDEIISVPEMLEIKAKIITDTKQAIKDLFSRESSKREAEIRIDENTSDGYHTFKELYEFRLLYNAALFNLMFNKAIRLLQDNEDTEVQETPRCGDINCNSTHCVKPSSKVEKLKELQRRFSTNLDYGAQWADLVKILNVLIEDEE